MEAVSRIDGTIADVPYESYFRHSRPVIVTGVVDRWAACEKWTHPYLRSVLADTQVPVGVARSRHFRLDPSQSELQHPRRMLEFATYANYVESGAGEDGLHYYLQRLPLSDYCPTLMADVPVPPFVDPELLTSQNLWFGPGGSCTALHWDDYDNAVAQISGRKQFTLFAPSETQHLYPHPALSHAPHQSRVNIDDVDPLKFPDFFKAECYSGVLHAGELLLLPACWWHQVTSIDTSISVNYWWKADLDSLLADNVAQMMREIGGTGTLTVLKPFLANLNGRVSFLDAAIRAQQIGRRWIGVMLALAALEEFLFAEGRRIGMWEERNISMDACKAAHQLLAVGVLTPDDLERLEAAMARAHSIREIPFEQTGEEDAQFMIDQAIAISRKPRESSLHC